MMNSVEYVKYLQEILGGGFVFAHVITFRILKPKAVNAFATENILWYVPDIHIVPFFFSFSLHSDIHFN